MLHRGQNYLKSRHPFLLSIVLAKFDIDVNTTLSSTTSLSDFLSTNGFDRKEVEPDKPLASSCHLPECDQFLPGTWEELLPF